MDIVADAIFQIGVYVRNHAPITEAACAQSNRPRQCRDSGRVARWRARR
jgi:hypothetical protein